MAGPVRPSQPTHAVPAAIGLLTALLAGAALGAIALQHGAASADASRHALAGAAVLVLAACVALAATALTRRRSPGEAQAPALEDPLTGLASDAGFRQQLCESIEQCRRRGGQLGVLVLNLRHFREVNELHGRAGGDLALRLIGARLRNAVRRQDLVARLAGDRFAVVQIDLQEPADARRLADRLAVVVAEPLPLDGGMAVTAADIGISVGPAEGTEGCLLLTRAEDALAVARAAPAPSIHCFAPDQEAMLRERRQLERDLREAIDRGAFLLHWQPQRRLADGALIGFEALLRWPHPTRGLIPPDAFIPLAEATGLIVPLGAWVLRTAANEAAQWPGGLKVAVNLSAVQIKMEGLVATVAQALTESGLPPHRLELEVTESVLMQDSQQAARVMAGLQALGVSIALDDFGTGWSSLAYLRRFPFDELKIDRYFLRDLDADPRVEAVVMAILGLGRGLGIRVVAEGVETQQQADRLLAMGCERGQGWLLGRPMPAEQARALIGAEAAAPKHRAVA
ncbi:putative bifunctional diguanylate cyclase/phosphodiesterase [Falsiroseomonas sp.]|uniref:putative bifunctional diguanylate cyclase/phosphodiesterase n=1 Tax=Falsiroseomonas sp. TaxID=2870721 RepID=UPI00356AE194